MATVESTVPSCSRRTARVWHGKEWDPDHQNGDICWDPDEDDSLKTTSDTEPPLFVNVAGPLLKPL